MKSEKDKYISDKIRELMAENRPQDQAVAIALSMANEKFKCGGTKYQDGGKNELPKYQFGTQQKSYKDPIVGQFYGQDISGVFKGYDANNPIKTQIQFPTTTYNPNYNALQNNNSTWLPGNLPINPEFGNVNFITQKPKTEVAQTPTENSPELQPEVKSIQSVLGENFKPYSQDTEAILQRIANEQKQTSVDLKYQETPDKSFTQQDPIQFFNPYGGVDLNSAASIFGQSLQSGDALSGVASGAKLLTGLGRNFMGGFAVGKAREEAIADYERNRRNAMTGVNQPVSMQEGGTANEDLQKYEFLKTKKILKYEKNKDNTYNIYYE